MTERSYPVDLQKLTNVQWRSTQAGTANGIIDRWNSPFNLSLSTVNDTATVKVGSDGYMEARVSGFYYKADANVALQLPGVTATTDYHIALCYNPANGAATQGPVQLVVYKGNNPPRAQGQEYLDLYVVTRANGQALSQATITYYRQGVAPWMVVHSEDRLQAPGDMIRNTTALIADTRQILTATYDGSGNKAWVDTLTGAWKPVTLPANNNWNVTRTLRSRRVGDTVQLQGVFGKANGTAFNDSSSAVVGTLPPEHAPTTYPLKVPCAASGYAGFALQIDTSGTITIYTAPAGSGYYCYLDGVLFAQTQT